MNSELKTIADNIRFCYSKMNEAELSYGHGFDNAWDESVFLVLATLNLPWDFDQALWNCRVAGEELAALHSAFEKRIKQRIPTAYIVNQMWFAGQPYFVDERVLVPRSPIAELIDNFYQPWLVEEPSRIMDLCCGSGCIGIASQLQFPGTETTLVDISSEALEVAGINIQRFGLEQDVSCFQSDLFEALDESHFGSYDLIVSNPPYVDKSDIDSMPDEYRHEPMLGLAAGPDGLDLVKRILRDAGKFLTATGVLIVELGNSWPALEQDYADVGFTWIEFERGGHGVFAMTAQELNAREW